MSVPSLSAQSGAGRIEGTARDTSGAIIPGTEVRAIRIETNQEFQAKANELGLYLFSAVQPGKYQLTASSPGMQPWQGEIVLRTGQVAVVDVTLNVGGAAEVVTVQGDVTPLVSTASATLGTTVERARIEQLPLNGRAIESMVQSTTPGLEGGANALRAYGLRAGSMDFV